MLPRVVIALLWMLTATCLVSYGQSTDSVTAKLVNLPSRLLGSIQSKTASLDQQLTTQTAAYLKKMTKEETRMKKGLSRLDSADTSGTKRTAALFAGHPEQQYAALLQKLKADSASAMKVIHGEYLAYADSMEGMLRFLQTNPQLLNTSKISPAQIQNTLGQVKQLQAKLQDAGEIQQFMQQRQAQLQQCLSRYTHLPSGIMNHYTNYNQQLYYYTEQVKAYKEALNDPGKWMQLAMTVLDRVPAFTSFIKNNSMLSSALNLPGAYNPSITGQGLSTRDQVMAAFQNQAAGGGKGGGQVGTGGGVESGGNIDPSAFIQQNVQSAQGEVDQLRAKLSSYGNSGSANVDIPNFQPNSQKTKSLFKRLEYGVNIQTVSGTFFFPATTDLGLSVGYKLSDKNVIGVGASYKIGWGRDLSHIDMTSQGASLRSFLDVNLKKSFFATGGFEYNYQQPFSLADMPTLKNWQPSGLLGISKIISLKTKVFKSTKIQLLWDFLSYQQIPKAPPFKFRIGYSF
jgi:hypothetical protein